MLTYPTLDQLHALGLHDAAAAPKQLVQPLARKALLDCERLPQRQGGDGQRRRMHPRRGEDHSANNEQVGMIVGAQLPIDD